MKGIMLLRKLTVIAVLCMTVLCVQGYGEMSLKQMIEQTDLLFESIENGYMERAKACVKAGVNLKDVKRINGRLCDALTYAVMCSRNDIVKILIEAGADVNAKSDDSIGYTVLMWAVCNRSDYYEKKTDIVEQLIKAGADVNAKDNAGNSALGYMVHSGDIGMAKLLIKAGADVNAKNSSGDPILMWASEYRMIKLLIDSGVNVNEKGSYGVTALMYAHDTNIARLLIDAGADVNAKNDYGDTALMGLDPFRSAAGLDSVDMAKFLIESGADINSRNKDGRTALWFATNGFFKNRDVAEFLQSVGAVY